MCGYANPYDFEPNVAGHDHEDGMDIVVEMWKLRAGAFFQSQAPTRDILDIFLLYTLQKYVHGHWQMKVLAVPSSVRYFLCLLTCVS